MVKVVWRDGLWRGLVLGADWPEGAEAATSPDEGALIAWARQYAAAQHMEVQVFGVDGELRTVYPPG